MICDKFPLETADLASLHNNDGDNSDSVLVKDHNLINDDSLLVNQFHFLQYDITYQLINSSK